MHVCIYMYVCANVIEFENGGTEIYCGKLKNLPEYILVHTYVLSICIAKEHKKRKNAK